MKFCIHVNVGFVYLDFFRRIILVNRFFIIIFQKSSVRKSVYTKKPITIYIPNLITVEPELF